MEKDSIKMGLAVIFSAILFVTFNSCSSDNEPEFNNENLVIERDIALLSKGYAALYDDMLKTILQDCKQISESNLNADVDKHFENFIESYVSQLTPEESKLLNRVTPVTRSGDQSKKPITIPDDFKEKIKPLLLVDDLSLLIDEINNFYNSKYFLSLDRGEQQELKIQLETLKITRNSMIETIIEHFQNEDESVATRSLGDRMVMSEAARHMNAEQIDHCIDATLVGISIVAYGPIAVAATLIGFALSFF
jgi:hypothetical protein